MANFVLIVDPMMIHKDHFFNTHCKQAKKLTFNQYNLTFHNNAMMLHDVLLLKL